MTNTYASIFLVFFLSFSANALQTKNCNPTEEAKIKAAVNGAPALLKEIRTQLALEIDPKSRRENYDNETSEKLRKAYKKTACIAAKIPKLSFECTNEWNRFTAQTLPIIGSKVKISNRFFNYEERRANAVIIHEASHKCGTNDIFGMSTQSLNSVADRAYHNTGAFYEILAVRGFCVPGYSCP